MQSGKTGKSKFKTLVAKQSGWLKARKCGCFSCSSRHYRISMFSELIFSNVGISGSRMQEGWRA